MKVTGLEWDAANVRHFREHGRCALRDVEDVLFARSHPTRVASHGKSESAEDRLVFFGRTSGGKYLAVVATTRPGHVLRPITCWPLPRKSIDRYDAWRKTVKR